MKHIFITVCLILAITGCNTHVNGLENNKTKIPPNSIYQEGDIDYMIDYVYGGQFPNIPLDYCLLIIL
jgi:hypothetical protein